MIVSVAALSLCSGPCRHHLSTTQSGSRSLPLVINRDLSPGQQRPKNATKLTVASRQQRLGLGQSHTRQVVDDLGPIPDSLALKLSPSVAG